MLGVNFPVSGGMSGPPDKSADGASRSSWPGRLVSVAVVLLVAALAAATFVVSYAGVRDLAIAAGVPSRFARLYPPILDGVLVVACAAAFVLRDGSLWRRLYAWFSVALLVAVVGTADAIHAMGVTLPKRPAAGTAAALPWALVMLGFSLWLTMLRHARSSPAVADSRPAPPTTLALPPAIFEDEHSDPSSLLPGFDPPVVEEAAPAEETATESVDEASPATDEAPEAEEAAEEDETAQVITPRFIRVRSTPLPPED